MYIKEDDFQAALDAQPDNHGLRLIFADWLDERGDERAAGYRAIGRNEKYVTMNWLSVGWDHAERNPVIFEWWSDVEVKGVLTIRPWAARLDAVWFNLIVPRWNFAPPNYPEYTSKDFASRREAEDAAAVAFAKLNPATQHYITYGYTVTKVD